MRLVIAIVQDKDAAKMTEQLIKNEIRATKLATTGGFLRAGNTTFLIGIEDERVDHLLQIIADSCRSREQFVTPNAPLGNQVESYVSYPVSVQVGGATVFVVPVDRYEHF